MKIVDLLLMATEILSPVLVAALAWVAAKTAVQRQLLLGGNDNYFWGSRPS
jgi:hypothetical protein